MLAGILPLKPLHSWRTVLEWLAAPWWMVLFFVYAALAALAVAYGVRNATTLMLPPLALFSVNLVAAIATRPVFRRDGPLLLFHVALLALVALFAVGRLTYLDAAVGLTRGASFDGHLVRDERGPLHRDRIAELRFANEGFSEQYQQRGSYKATYNLVRWWDAEGLSHLAEIGDDHPLLMAGYRIYSTKQRGYAPVFHWQGDDGREDIGAVQLNDMRLGHYAPANQWQTPRGDQVWGMLRLQGEQMPKPQPGGKQADLRAGELDHALVLRIGQQREELRPGDSIAVPGGRLTYVRLDTWMSYRIVYDPTQPWLVATVLVAIGSLIVFYLRRFRGLRSLA